MQKRIKAGVAGFTGYSGAEAVELLRGHPFAEPVLLEHREASDSERPAFDDGIERRPFDSDGIAGLDVVFLATSAEVSLEAAPMALAAGARVVDLSGAYRLRTVERFKRWYGLDHTHEDLLASAAYGLPELCREQIAPARLVANPGCYPTAASLAIRPLVTDEIYDPAAGIVCDAKSGVSGAGRKPSLKTHFCEVTENFSAYAVMMHRHVPEVLQNTGLDEAELSFTAHLLPLHRGILETIYLRTKRPLEYAELAAVYLAHYGDETFVRIYPEGRLPDLKAIHKTNYCDIGIRADPTSKRVTIVAAIDNLTKGAAGQAVQNLNLMFGFDETAGLL